MPFPLGLMLAFAWYWQAAFIVSLLLFNVAMIFLIIAAWKNFRNPQQQPTRPSSHPLQPQPAKSSPSDTKQTDSPHPPNPRSPQTQTAPPDPFSELDHLKATAENSPPPGTIASLYAKHSGTPTPTTPPTQQNGHPSEPELPTSTAVVEKSSTESSPQTETSRPATETTPRESPDRPKDTPRHPSPHHPDPLAPPLAILDALAEAILTLDRHGVILSCNKTTEQLFGSPRPLMVGQPLDRFLTIEGEENLGTQHPVANDGQTLAMEHEAWGLRSDGTRFPALVTVSVLRTEPFVLAVAVRNIQSRKEREKSPHPLSLDQFQPLEAAAARLLEVASQFSSSQKRLPAATFKSLQAAASQFLDLWQKFLAASTTTTPSSLPSKNQTDTLPSPQTAAPSNQNPEESNTAVACEPVQIFLKAIQPVLENSRRQGIEWRLDGLDSPAPLCFLPESLLARTAFHLAKWAAAQPGARGIVASLERLHQPSEKPSFLSPLGESSLSAATVEGIYFRIATITSHPEGIAGKADLDAALLLAQKAGAQLQPLPPFDSGRGWQLSCFAHVLALPAPISSPALPPQSQEPSQNTTPAIPQSPPPPPPADPTTAPIQTAEHPTPPPSTSHHTPEITPPPKNQTLSPADLTGQHPSATPAEHPQPSQPTAHKESIPTPPPPPHQPKQNQPSITPPPSSQKHKKPTRQNTKSQKPHQQQPPLSPAPPTKPSAKTPQLTPSPNTATINPTPQPETPTPPSTKPPSPEKKPSPISTNPTKQSPSAPQKISPATQKQKKHSPHTSQKPPPLSSANPPPQTPSPKTKKRPSQKSAPTQKKEPPPAPTAPPPPAPPQPTRHTAKKILSSLRAASVVEDPSEQTAVSAALEAAGLRHIENLSPFELLDALRKNQSWDLLILQLDHSEAADFDLTYEVRQYLPESELTILTLPAITEAARQIPPLHSVQGEFDPSLKTSDIQKLLLPIAEKKQPSPPPSPQPEQDA